MTTHHTIMESQSITFFASEGAAKAIAEANAASDPDTDYVVKPAVGRAGKFTISVIERETGAFVFYL